MEKTNDKTDIIKVLPNKSLTKSSNNVKRDIPKYFDKEHIREVIPTITNHEHRMFITFLWMSGVRVTEAINVQVKDISPQDNIIKVKWLKSRKWNDRNVPIHSQLMQILTVFCGGMNRDQKVFSFSRQRAWQITKKWFNCSPHTFRHSFAVNYLREGGNIVNLFRILGHSKIQTTMEYLKIVPSDLSKELETIGF